MATILVKNSFGRVLLHAGAILRGGNVRWHAAGIARELFPAKSVRTAALDSYILRDILGVAYLVLQFC